MTGMREIFWLGFTPVCRLTLITGSVLAGVRYEPSSWPELQNAIAIGTLESLSLLGRRPEDLEMYKRFKETEILSSWVTIQDYLMCQVFGCPWAVDSAAGNYGIFYCILSY